MTPEVFGELLLVGRLSARSMSEVFLAVRLGDRSGRLFVVKRPALGERASGAVAESLRREAAVLGAKRWPGAVVLDSAGTMAGLPYVAVEHVRGVSLDQLLGGAPLSEAAAFTVGRDLARTLAELHAAGWVHGDVAPSNVVIDDAGELVLVDFGLARKVDEPREGPSGKPGYASPEAALGRPAQTTDDVYAWGAVVAECLTGRRLFDEHELVQASTRGPELPSAIAAHPIVAKALALDATSRPRAGELAALATGAGARAELADRATRATSAVRDSAEDPAPSGARLTQPVSAVPPVVMQPIPKPASPSLLDRRMLAIAGAALMGVALLSFVVGRRTAKVQAERRDARITFPALPARAEIKMDGRTVLVPEAGRPLSIEPGRHTVTVTIARDEREYDVFVEPGDNVVLVPVARVKANKKEKN